MALIPWGRLSVVVLLLAGGALTLYAFLPLQSSFVYGYRAWLVFGPAWAYLLWSLWRTRRHWELSRSFRFVTIVASMLGARRRFASPTSKVSRETSASPSVK